MYYRSPCLFFRNTVRSASSCFRVRQDHYGARGLWPDHARARGLWPDHAHARGLARPLRAPTTSITSRAAPLSSDHVSGTSSLAPRPVLGDCLDHGSGTSSLAPRPMLGDCLDHSPTIALGLRCLFLDLRTGTASTTLRPRLGDFASRLHATGNSHTVGDSLSHLDLATRLIPRLPVSSGTTSVRCTYRCILYRLYDDWILNLTGNSF